MSGDTLDSASTKPEAGTADPDAGHSQTSKAAADDKKDKLTLAEAQQAFSLWIGLLSGPDHELLNSEEKLTASWKECRNLYLLGTPVLLWFGGAFFPSLMKAEGAPAKLASAVGGAVATLVAFGIVAAILRAPYFLACRVLRKEKPYRPSVKTAAFVLFYMAYPSLIIAAPFGALASTFPTQPLIVLPAVLVSLGCLVWIGICTTKGMIKFGGSLPAMLVALVVVFLVLFGATQLLPSDPYLYSQTMGTPIPNGRHIVAAKGKDGYYIDFLFQGRIDRDIPPQLTISFATKSSKPLDGAYVQIFTFPDDQSHVSSLPETLTPTDESRTSFVIQLQKDGKDQGRLMRGHLVQGKASWKSPVPFDTDVTMTWNPGANVVPTYQRLDR